MLGALREIRDRVGQDKFPLNDVTYHSSASSMIISPSMPCVLKVLRLGLRVLVLNPSFSSLMRTREWERFESTISKVLCYCLVLSVSEDGSKGFEDMRTVCALHDEYLSAEPFFPYDSGIRVQKCCNTYRVWEKIPTGSSWKSQFGGSDLKVSLFGFWSFGGFHD
jgi:hypothetical protein